MERFVCNQTMFVSMERRNGVIDAAVLRDVATAVYPNTSVSLSGNDSEQILSLGPTVVCSKSQKRLGKVEKHEHSCRIKLVSPCLSSFFQPKNAFFLAILANTGSW